MSERLQEKLRGLVNHAVHPKHREEPEARAKATAACDILDTHWDELFPMHAAPSTEIAKPTKPGVGATFSKHGVEPAPAFFHEGTICTACDRPIMRDSQILRHKPGHCDLCSGRFKSFSTICSKEELIVHNDSACREWLRDDLLERERNAPKRGPFDL